jgi:cytochrome c1
MSAAGRSRAAVVAALSAGALAAACGTSRSSSTVPGGDPQRGRDLIAQYGCGSCHVIDGVRGADGTVGPPLAHFGTKRLIAGTLPRTRANAIRWIRDPPAVKPITLMPVLGVRGQDARDIVAYLYSQ